jgi:(2R)-3-sulfolactate dehydrogenase (NADP+)
VTIAISATDLTALCAQAARTAGADHNAAASLATATVAAEQAGNRAVGVAHLFDYLQAYQEGRICSGVVPEIIHPAPGVGDR